MKKEQSQKKDLFKKEEDINRFSVFNTITLIGIWFLCLDFYAEYFISRKISIHFLIIASVLMVSFTVLTIKQIIRTVNFKFKNK